MRKTRMTGGVIRVFVYREKTAADVWNTAAKVDLLARRPGAFFANNRERTIRYEQEKRLKNKIWTGLLTAALVFSMFPVSVLAAGEEYGITVNDQPVTSANAADVLGDGTVSYDPETNTLKLSGAKLKKIDNQTGETFTITVAGENAVNLENSEETSLVDSNAPVVLNGEGSLTLSGINQNSYIKCLNSAASSGAAGDSQKVLLPTLFPYGSRICGEQNKTPQLRKEIRDSAVFRV